MKAATLEQYGRIIPRNIPVPKFSQDEVLVKVHYASICGSDQHIYKGEFHPRTKLPLVPGHEFAGEIAEVGRNVNGFSPGQKLTVDPIIPCGKCPACQRKHYPACTSLKLIGIDLDGGFAEYVAVKPEMIYLLPPNISNENAALIELLSIGFHASKRSELGPEDDIVIWGAGKVGQAILHAAKTITRGKIFITDILEERLALARKTFPDIHCINIRETDPLGYISEYTEGKGVDLAFEAIGHYQEVSGRLNPVRSCIRAIRGGGKVCVLGLSDDPTPVLFKELIWKEARIISSRVSHGEFADSIAALEKDSLDPSGMITGIMDLSQADEAFQLLESEPEKHLKILLKVSS